MNIVVSIPKDTLERFYELGQKSWTLITDEERLEWERIKQVIALKVYWEYVEEKKIERRNGNV